MTTYRNGVTYPAGTRTPAKAASITITDTDNQYSSSNVEDALSEVRGETLSYVSKAQAVLETPVNGTLRFINGSDGGLFKEVTGAAAATYSDNGGSYCGTQFIPTGGDGSAAWVRVDGGYNVGLGYNPLWFGAVGDGATIENTAIDLTFATAGLNLVHFPKGSIGVYVINKSIVLPDAYRMDGDNIEIKADATFVGSTVDLVGGGTTVLSSMITFLTGNFDDNTGVQRENAYVGAGINLNCNEVAVRGLYIERMPYSHIACNVFNSVAGAGAIDIGTYCWGIHLDNNIIENFTEAAIKVGEAANGILISRPVIWGKNKTGTVGINFVDGANSNGIEISGGFIEKIVKGIKYGQQNGPLLVNGVDFEVCTNVLYAVGDETAPVGREIGPVTFKGCYLDATGSKIFADRANVTVEGCRLRTGVDFETSGSGIIYSKGNEFENAAPSIAANSLVVLEEERVWTPVLWDDTLSSGEGQTASIAVGSYTMLSKDLVHVKGRIAVSSLGTLTGASTARIGPLPFTSSSTANSHSPVTVGYANNLALAAANSVAGYVGVGVNYINLTKFSATTGTTNLTVTEVTASGDLMFSVIYSI